MKNSEELTETVMEVVIHFQDVLNENGLLITFDESLIRQAEGALQLLEFCSWDVARAKGLIELYCLDRWWVHHQPYLDQVVKRADVLQQQCPAPYLMGKTWETL